VTRHPIAASLLLGSLAMCSPVHAGERRAVFASVMQQDGTPVQGLSAINFRGEFNGRPAGILSAAWDDSPRRVSLLVDISGSMKDRREWAGAWEAAQEIISTLTPRHRVALFTVGDAVRQQSMLTGDRRMLQQALEQAKALDPRGGSPLYDAVMAALTVNGEAFGDAICLVSDGEDTTSRAPLREAEAAMARAGVRLFWIRTAPSFQVGVRMASIALEWADLTRATGGSVFDLRRYKRDQLTKELRSFCARITQGYRLEIAIPEPVGKRRNWDLEVVDAKARPLKGIVLTYQRALVPSSDAKSGRDQ
jgi:hypothetical protein